MEFQSNLKNSLIRNIESSDLLEQPFVHKFVKNVFPENVYNELINNIPIAGKRTVYVNEPLVIISGSILDEKEKQLDSIFLLVDDKPFIKFDNSAQSYSEWKIFFMSGYLENNCQLISIAGFNDNKNIRLNQEIELCKNNLP